MRKLPFHLFILHALLCIGLLPSFSNAQDWKGFPSFPDLSLTVGDGPYSVTTGDFNGDGITDLAIPNLFSDDLSVLLGNEDDANPGFGDGTFATQATYTVGDGPVSVTTGDFNGDGILDLTTANNNSDNVSILLGNEDGANPGFGDGTFAVQFTYTADDSPQSVTTGDFNGDGITDLVTSNFFPSNVSVLLGNEDGANPGFGDGTFAAHVTYAAGTSLRSVITGDFNGDGITDLATANYLSNNVSVLLGDEDGANPGFGDGTFAAQVTYAVGIGPNRVTVGDFNGDGITDLATANEFSDNVSVLLGNENGGNPGFGDGTFAAHVTYAAGGRPVSVTTGDFNGDGITDLATGNFNSDDVSVMLGVGNGAFATAINYAAGDGPASVTTGDFNGDGNTDLATANQLSDNVTVLLNLGYTEPALEIAPSSLDFGNVELGSAAINLSTVLENIGDADLLTTATLTNNGGGAYSLISSPVSPLSQSTTTTLEVSFTANALGVIVGEVLLDTNTTSGTVTVALTGTGVDTQAPTSAATGPSGSVTQMSALLDVTYTAGDGAGSGVANVELFYQRNGGGFASYGTFTSSPISFDTSGTGGNGTYDFYTVATDNASNTEVAPVSADASVIFTNNTSVNDWSVLND